MSNATPIELIASLIEGSWTCEGCGETFTGTGKEAFEAGWDAPPYFESHVTCSKCPITSTIWWALMTGAKNE